MRRVAPGNIAERLCVPRKNLARSMPPRGRFDRKEGMSINYGIEARDAEWQWQYFRSQAEAARAGHCQQSVSLCLAGKRKTHKGLVWNHAGPCGRLKEYTTTFCQREANGPPITNDELWEAYRAWVPPEWLQHLDREDFDRAKSSGWYWKATAPHPENV